MIVVYRSRKDHSPKSYPDGQWIELNYNHWDDYGYKTTLLAELVSVYGKRSLGSIKVLLAEDQFTARYLEGLVERGWDGIFPIPDMEYISNPRQVTFYEELFDVAGADEAMHVAALLKDAGYFTRVHENPDALTLTQSDGFALSLQRERGDQMAFNEGWKLFVNQAMKIGDTMFRFRDRDGRPHDVMLRYLEDNSLLPRDINLLIGPNGAGKSQFLLQLVEEWLQTGDAGARFTSYLGFNRLIAVSYSPFERLRVDTQGISLQDEETYLYFGLRTRAKGASKGEALSLDNARKTPAISLATCIADDARFRAIKAWSQKINTLYSVLRLAIDFDTVALAVPPNMAGETFGIRDAYLSGRIREPTARSAFSDEQVGYLPIDQETAHGMNVATLMRHLRPNEGVTFFKDGDPLSMSSGQRLFSYIVINILGAIRRNSLIVIDEPELFLHPTLEIGLVTMLKSILETYSCKALIATHSALLTREVPSDCVHVFQPTPEGLRIGQPPFQTLGADVQRISSYVFGDNGTSKPFEKWLHTVAQEEGGANAVLNKLRPDELNEELMMELRARGSSPR